MYEDDSPEPSSPGMEWPQPWGDDPIVSRNRHIHGDPRLSKAFSAINKAKNAAEWEVHWTPEALWEHGEDISIALAALDTCLYGATRGVKKQLDSLVNSFERGAFPSRPLAAWRERWMRDKFATFLCESKPDTQERRLADLVLDQWPWVFGWAGQGSQNYFHPIVRAVRSGNYDLAESMMEKIPADHWLDWGNAYNLRDAWQEARWRQGDVSWFNKITTYDPRILAINPSEGMGPLEMAVKRGSFEIVDQLLTQGMAPDPSQSFGLSLSHWAVHGLSHSKWNARRQEFEPKTSEEIERDAVACGRTLGVLSRHGHGMDVPVVKMKPIPGIRRKGGLPKAPETAAQLLERKRAEEKLSDKTIALVQQAYMIESTPPPAPSSSSASRPRL